MKSIDIFCSSPASTAVCSNSGKHATPRRWQDLIRKVPDGGGNEIGSRFHNSRKSQTKEVPCSSSLPIDAIVPAFCGRKSTSSAVAAAAVSSSRKADKVMRRKSSADVRDVSEPSTYLLSDKPFLDFIPDSGRAVVSRQLLRSENDCNNGLNKYKRLNSDGYSGLRSFSSRSLESPIFRPSSKGSNSPKKSNTRPSVHESALVPSSHQVVELWVSIHCKGCEGKLRKHLSRMEGVTSFTIDLATKKVTVTGQVTPLGVLSSVSKVKKYAGFWSPSPASSTIPCSSLRTGSTLTGVTTARSSLVHNI